MSTRKIPAPRFAAWEPVVGRVAETGPEEFVLEVVLDGVTIRERFQLDPETAHLLEPLQSGARVRVLAEPLTSDSFRSVSTSGPRMVRWVESGASEWAPGPGPRIHRRKPTPGQLGMFGGEVQS